MVWCKDLTMFRFLLITIEFVEEDSHYIFTIPEIRINIVRYLRDPIYKVINCLLILGGILRILNY